MYLLRNFIVVSVLNYVCVFNNLKTCNLTFMCDICVNNNNNNNKNHFSSNFKYRCTNIEIYCAKIGKFEHKFEKHKFNISKQSQEKPSIKYQ